MTRALAVCAIILVLAAFAACSQPLPPSEAVQSQGLATPQVSEPTESTELENQAFPCPVSEVDYHFWKETGGVAGEFPVWMSSHGESIWSESRVGPVVLPPKSDPDLFSEGHLAKTLIFVDEGVEGDLTITGERVPDGRPIYFHNASNSTRISDTTLQLLAVPPTSMVIASANSLDRSPNPPGKATHGMGPIYTGPGCWRFTFRIAGFETQVFKSFVRD